jgi:hypothetical protein
MKCGRWLGNTPHVVRQPMAGNTFARRDSNEPPIFPCDRNSRLQRTDCSVREDQLY